MNVISFQNAEFLYKIGTHSQSTASQSHLSLDCLGSSFHFVEMAVPSWRCQLTNSKQWLENES